MAVAKKRIGEMLLEAGIIDETQLKAALGHQRQWGVRLGQALVDLKLATEADIVGALSVKYGFAVAELGALEPYALEQALKLLPREFALRNNVLPMAADTASITVAMSDPTNLAVVDEIRFRTGRKVKVCIGGDREVAEAVRRHYPGGNEVEAIALDLDVDDAEAEALFDPFGGGSKDALEAFFGGGTRTVVLDNLKAGVVKADLYDPTLNRAYQELERHYGFVADPAKVRTPEHKGKVEGPVAPLLQDAEARRVDVEDREDDRHGKDQLRRDPRELPEPHLGVVLGDLLDREQDRLHGGDAAEMGAPSRARCRRSPWADEL